MYSLPFYLSVHQTLNERDGIETSAQYAESPRTVDNFFANLAWSHKITAFRNEFAPLATWLPGEWINRLENVTAAMHCNLKVTRLCASCSGL